MKRVVTIVLAALTAAAALLTPGADAAAGTAPTLSAPAVARYYSVITLSGTTQRPDAPVIVFVRRAGQPRYSELSRLSSDASAHFAVRHHAVAIEAFYAVSGGVHSAVRVTRLVTASCTVSGPAFRTLPVRGFVPSDPSFAEFTATRSGTWAGVAFVDSDFAVISWRYGHPLRVLDRFHYANQHPSTLVDGVQVVGLTADGTAVAQVQSTGQPFESQTFYGYAWINGRRHMLAHSASWSSFAPVGVADNGTIAGWVRIGSPTHGRFYVVSWASPSAPYRVVATGKDQNPSVVVDGAGDIAYSLDGTAAFVRLPSGERRELGDEYDGPVHDYPQLAAGHSIYAGTQFGVARWNLSSVPRTGRIPRTLLTAPASTSAWVTSVSHRGDLINGLRGPRYLLTTSGVYRRMPAEYVYPASVPAGEAIDGYGQVAFTSAADGLVHFLRCR